MFSGIVEELGEVVRVARKGRLTLVEVKADKVLADSVIGDSIALNGACLTIVKKQAGVLAFEVMPQTLAFSNLFGLKIGEKVNLERALKVGERVSGHFVTGHIDCPGTIRRKYYSQGNLSFEINYPAKFAPYIFPQGSIAVDGISLTVAEKRSTSFSVYIIPHTLANTTFSFKGPGYKVNLEFDILAKK